MTELEWMRFLGPRHPTRSSNVAADRPHSLQVSGVQHKGEAAGHRVTLVEEDRATTSGRSRAAIHRWTTVAKKPALRWPHKATSHHNFWTPAPALSATGMMAGATLATEHVFAEVEGGRPA